MFYLLADHELGRRLTHAQKQPIYWKCLLIESSGMQASGTDGLAAAGRSHSWCCWIMGSS